MSDRSILLVDGHNLALRTWFARSERGTLLPDPVGVGRTARATVMNWLRGLGFQARHAVMTFDQSNGGGFRAALHPEYKATRKTPDPERGHSQREAVAAVRLALLDAGLQEVTVDGWEADDVLATLAARAREYSRQTVILTNDGDLCQCLNEWTRLASPEQKVPGPGALLTAEQFHQRKGYPARLVPDYKALVGEATDNIPPGGGIGATTAPKLLDAYGSLPEIYGRLGEIELDRAFGARVVAKLRENEDAIKRNLRLTTLDRAVPGVALPTPLPVARSVVQPGVFLAMSPDLITTYKVLSVEPATDEFPHGYARVTLVRAHARGTGASYIGQVRRWSLLNLLTGLQYETVTPYDGLPPLSEAEAARATTQRPDAEREVVTW